MIHNNKSDVDLALKNLALDHMRSLKYSCGECEYVAITQIYVKRH